VLRNDGVPTPAVVAQTKRRNDPNTLIKGEIEMFSTALERPAFSKLVIRYPVLPTFVFFIIMVIVFVVFSPTGVNNENLFLSRQNLYNIVEATAGYSIGAFAMTLILLVGCIDLSCEGVIALAAVVLGICLEWKQMGFATSLLITLGVGALCGLLNSLIVIKFKVPSFLATISVTFIFVGMAYMLTQAKSILLMHDVEYLIRGFGSIGSGATFLGIPVLLAWTVFFLLLYYILIGRSKFGRWAQATGGNEYAAFSSGINTNLVRLVAFVLMGVVAAFIGIIFCARLSSVSANYGTGYSLKFIIAAILGGTGFTGEGGNVFGTLLGSLVMGVLTNGLSLMGYSIYIQQVITGIVIVAAVVFSVYLSRKR
jgi:ribose transport system permease protein